MKIIKVEVVNINIKFNNGWCDYVPSKNWYWTQYTFTINAIVKVTYTIPPYTRDIIKVGVSISQIQPFIMHNAEIYEAVSSYADNLDGSSPKTETKTFNVVHTGYMNGYVQKDVKYTGDVIVTFTAHDDNALMSTTVKYKYRTLNCNVTIEPIKAEFYVTNVNTNKTEYYVGETVYVSAKVVNKSSIDGYANISIKVDGNEVKTDRVYVIANYYQNVSYKISNLGVGSHEICVGVK